VSFLQNYRAWLPLVLILLLAGALRLYGIADHDYWLDEFLTAELSTGRGSVHLNIPPNTIIDPPPATTSLADPGVSPPHSPRWHV